MKKTPIGIACTVLLLSIFSCKKTEIEALPETKPEATEETLASRHGGASKCDYVQASSTRLEPGEFMFTKEYQNGKLDKITAGVLNLTGGGLEGESYTVIHSYRKMEFVSEWLNLTVVSLEFDNKGRVIYASTNGMAIPFSNNFRPMNFRFLYSNGRLSEIQYYYPIDPQYCEDYPELCEGEPVWEPYVKIHYDKNFKNVVKLSLGTEVSITYTYDYNKKVANQYYPSEYLYDFYDFFTFVSHLNLFPELQSQNLLVRSLFIAPGGYPAEYERTYSNHAFDTGNRLISYDVVEKWEDNEDTLGPYNWNIAWDCK
jgi:hypothetical protein